MKPLLSLVAIFTVGLCCMTASLALDLPEPPDGFTWKRIPEIKASFLMPAGWHFKREKQKGILAYFITAEDFDKVGRFDTGLSLNVRRNLKSTNAVEYAKSFIAQMGKDNEVVRSWETEMGLLHGYGCLTRNAGKAEEPTIMMHTLAIGNAKTNTLYVLWFESLEPEWDKAWTKGERILKLFVLDDEF
jgi:hypothetical protein